MQEQEERKVEPLSRKISRILFYTHLILITIVTIFITIYGLIFSNHNHNFKPFKWYLPILTSILSTAIFSFLYQWFTSLNPSKAIKTAFFLSPWSTLLAGLLLLYIDSSVSLASGVITIVCALIISLYGCWVSPRFDFAIRVLSVSISSPPAKTQMLLLLSTLSSVLYSCFLVVGIGGTKAAGIKLQPLFILLILASLVWTMIVIRNILVVTISKVKFMNFSNGDEMDTIEVLKVTLKKLLGSVCIGSVLIPIIGVIRGSARFIKLIAGDTDEFLFSCANCYSGLGSTLVMFGNRWGFVQLGVYNKGIVQSSRDTWEMFKRVGLEELIDSDLTGSFCFFCGLVGGSICCLVSGGWASLVQKSYATEISLYGFLVGYFVVRD